MSDFLMPSLGADMEEGTIIKWLVKPGDIVHRGDIVLEVETEKADMEVEIFEDGVVGELVASEGEVIPVGGVLARIQAVESVLSPSALPSDDAGRREEEAPSEAAPGEIQVQALEQLAVEREARLAAGERPRITPTARNLAKQASVDLASVEGTGLDGAITRADVERASKYETSAPHAARTPVTPLARRLAVELGVDLGDVDGSGPNGEVTADDVCRTSRSHEATVPSRAADAARPLPAAPQADESTTKDRSAARQRVIAALMERSKREVPHYYLSTTIDLTRTLAWLQERNARRPVAQRLLPSVIMLRAVVKALDAVPEMNGTYEGGVFKQSEMVNLGVAISLREGGLAAPAIQDAANKSINDLMGDLRELVQRSRAGKLRAAEMSNATITVTNLGDQGVESVFGVIYVPQVAIVGLGKVVERPWAERGMVGTRQIVTATLAADHRVSNGHRGALYLAAIDRLLQEPEQL